MSKLHQELLNRYIEILSPYPEFLDLVRKEEKVSHLFLGFVPDNYENAEGRKILVIGRETKGWKYAEKMALDVSLSDKSVVEKLMNDSKRVFNNAVEKSNTKGKSFFNFIRSICDHSGKDGVLWGNIFAFEYNRGNPEKWKEGYAQLVEISGKLLKAQIEVLKPDVIVFCHGSGGLKARWSYFPNKKMITDRTFQENEKKKYPIKKLWKFKMPESNAVCYRINHPSSFSRADAEVRNKLISLLPKK